MANPVAVAEVPAVNRYGLSNTTQIPKDKVPDRPTPAEVILPSFVLIICNIILIIIISCCTQRRWWKKRLSMKKEKSAPFENIGTSTRDTDFLTGLDRAVIDNYLCFPNQPYFLFIISLPAMVSLILCPFALYLYEPFVEAFWPSELFGIIPKINDVIACFLMPAGLVYAIAFGFGFQEASTKRSFMTDNMTKQISHLCQIVMLTFVVEELPVPHKLEIFRNLKEEVLDWMKVLTGQVQQDTTDCLHGNLYPAVGHLNRALKKCDGKRLTLLPKLNEVAIELDALMSARGKHTQRSMPIVQWMFLEVLGFFSFFGILLLRADSYKLELAMQIVTVFSISFFCYVLADLDSPYHGAFHVPLEQLVTFLYHLEQASMEVRRGIPRARRGTRYSIPSRTTSQLFNP